jgi:TPP-dependent pyruvate/acetoin dehydrogenase alpha subunit
MPPVATAGTERSNQTERIFGMFKTMLLIRAFEESAHQLLTEGLVHGSVHQSIGQEAISVAVCGNMRRDDLIQSNHRGHAHAIAKGANPTAMMKELLGRVGGTNGGKGGSMHIADFSVGMLGANGILADGMSLAAGAAQAVSLKGEDKVVGVFVGDGSTNRGPFYEGLNWAKVFHLPLLVVCEDNGYASTTATRSVTSGGGPAVRAASFDIPVVSVDGNDLRAVDAAAADLVERIRNGRGPQFLHAATYRLTGHVSKDQGMYRPAGELEERWSHEPVRRCEAWLAEQGVSPSDIETARSAAQAIIAASVAEAKAAPFPDPSLAYADVQDVGGPSCPK